ncbi:ATP synthase F1 subunit delta [Fructilactobacillus florum]|uniref:ATP synthase subunit delta n=1 Tax=Fructilactobacillus florum DSM 22689 = JCM 16035 TaxID=1423745 RepID=A0A0R2CWJ8_9LACO|nr:ATP synthase F1 subunit delta [Fructilactobacillus florum]KRM92459.1 ATP synthase subunit delta [Fructilactobacillus florum DSM 22689 = JCM 16035]
MSLSKLDVAKRYSKALYETLSANNQISAGQADLNALKSVFTANPTLVQALTSVGLTHSQKVALLNPLLTAADTPSVSKMVQMLFDYGRIDDLVAVVDQFNDRYNDEHGIVRATVATAVPLDALQQAKIAQALSKRLQVQHVNLDVNVDPSLIGGLVVHSAGVVFDGSVRTKIQQMRQLLLS